MRKGITSILLVIMMLASVPADFVFAETAADGGVSTAEPAVQQEQLDEGGDASLEELSESAQPEEIIAGEGQQELASNQQDAEEEPVTTEGSVSAEETAADDATPQEETAAISPEDVKVTLDTRAYPYTGSAIKPSPKVVIIGEDGTEKELKKDTDYTVTYKDKSGNVTAAPTSPGAYQIVVAGTGEYEGTAKQTVSFTIDALPIRDAAVSGVSAKDYTGRALTQTPTVKMTVDGRQVVLQNGTDYTLSYKNNTKAGTATMVITGRGVYTGTKEVAFKIRPMNNKKGWRKRNGRWYYYYKDDKMLTSGWAKDSKGWCYLSNDGTLLTNGWAKDSHGWCWMNSTGRWMKGSNKWIRTGGEWYYLRSNGYRATCSWLKDTHGWCYADADGKLRKSGWAKDHKGWCWLDANGYYNPGKWRKDGKGWYYRDGTGTLLTNRWVRDSKGWCWVNSNGYYDASKRYYQNPSWMVQISTSISKHGLSYYVSPLEVSIGSDRSDHIEAMIGRAYDYLGDPFVVCQSRAPGKGVDCSGIVMQACYAAGVDLWPSNPSRHRQPAYEYESREIWKMKNLESVPWSQRQRGDLIFYANNSGTVIHIAIYLGNNKVIHSYPNNVRVSSVYGWGNIKGVKRVFH